MKTHILGAVKVRGVKSVRWIATACRVWQLEAFGVRMFFGLVTETSSPDVWSWHCYGGHGEAKTVREAKDAVERFLLPLFRYAESTTWGDNTHALFELCPKDGAITRAAGSLRHCVHYLDKLRVSKPGALLEIVPVHYLRPSGDHRG